MKRTRAGRLRSFIWQGFEYPIAEVIATWHLMDRWWELPTNPAIAVYSLDHRAQDRTYYRVCCRAPDTTEQVFDLFHDAVTMLWVLDVAHD